ncbi:MAG: nickel-dependent lactate racemase [Veillonellaceae bacterium]|nr:nickel-dependent lactate racemase [Veillonellaceae bacterium]
MSTYHMPYGRGEISFDLPAERVKKVLEMAEMTPLDDPVAAIRNALSHPIDSPPLAELAQPGQTVAIIVNDTTRIAHTDVFLPLIVETLTARGVRDDDITVLFALGMHRPMTAAEMIDQIGPEMYRRLRCVNAEARCDEDYVTVGTTSYGTPVAFHRAAVEADLLILTGSVVHHFFAGFGGGRKALFPGVAHQETIRRNHSLMLDPAAVIGELHHNPIYLDQIEGCEMHRPSFLLNTVLNEKKEFIGVFAGDYITAHEAACELVDRMNGVPIDEEYPIVIATCGGYPKDINIYQAQKTMDNAVCAVREGGVVILLAECEEGSGSAEFDATVRNYPSPTAIEEYVRRDFQIGRHKAYAVTRLMKKADFYLLSAMPDEDVRAALFTPVHSVAEALTLAEQKLGPAADICLMPQGSYTVPRLRK